LFSSITLAKALRRLASVYLCNPATAPAVAAAAAAEFVGMV